MLSELDAATSAFDEAFLAVEGDQVRLVWGEETLKSCAEALGLRPAGSDFAPQGRTGARRNLARSRHQPESPDRRRPLVPFRGLRRKGPASRRRHPRRASPSSLRQVVGRHGMESGWPSPAPRRRCRPAVRPAGPAPAGAVLDLRP
ncbi:MAG: hypothetical protein WDN06_05765 [Asticcacaulis sp.]